MASIRDKLIICNTTPFLGLISSRSHQLIARQWRHSKQRKRNYSIKPQRVLFSSVSSPSFLFLPWSCSPYFSSSSSSSFSSSYSSLSSNDQLIEFSPSAKADAQYINVVPGFATPDEEKSIVKEILRTLRGKKYQYDHWDEAIEGYKETEKSHWMEDNMALIERLNGWTRNAVKGKQLETLAEVHALDLAEDGQIKPHIDSVRFCGEVISGVSLLSSSVMQFRHEKDPDKWINIFLPKLSLYCMTGVVRYNYTHAIPKGEESVFMGKKIVRERRLSLICRTVLSTNS